MNGYELVKRQLLLKPQSWLVTGGAGFIGSNLVRRLLELDQKVVALDNLLTGSLKNIEEVLRLLPPQKARNFSFVQGDIRDMETCRQHCQGVDVVLHQAALGSVPRSISDPVTTNQHNVDGFLNMLVAARDAGVRRFVYASSSSVYGDCRTLPQVEEEIGAPLSPYAATKYINELYAGLFSGLYRLETVGLRYFNVFGERQDPESEYAAVIPKWFAALLRGEPVYIYGDGETSRDFCYIENVVQANLLAACAQDREVLGKVYNIACSRSTTLKELFYMIRGLVAEKKPAAAKVEPVYEDFRPGDIRHSLADTAKAARLLGYRPTHFVAEGLREAAGWYIRNLR
ncbi:MAG: SDR family oxidoreductase [Peptococcaceae bacterium]|jgi:UDP-N-acetylglucosamine 4-epimerase|nr:SDR family oxidoreductase [Peptococcaceae bacterium]MDH7525997.1 SDR family oxidoreductase [Peptococcaceae bacterium]